MLWRCGSRTGRSLARLWREKVIGVASSEFFGASVRSGEIPETSYRGLRLQVLTGGDHLLPDTPWQGERCPGSEATERIRIYPTTPVYAASPLLPRIMKARSRRIPVLPRRSASTRSPLPGEALDMGQRHVRDLERGSGLPHSSRLTNQGFAAENIQARRGVRRICISVEPPRRTPLPPGGNMRWPHLSPV